MRHTVAAYHRILLGFLLAAILGCTDPILIRSQRVLVFTADWCVNCKQHGPQLAIIREHVYSVVIVDIDGPEFASGRYDQYGITKVPTYVIVNDSNGPSFLKTHDINTVMSYLRVGT